MINLEELFIVQKLLDKRIVDEHKLHGQDLLPKKILALKVELGELANELPETFKFWSNKINDYEKALNEFVDGLHFILSIGNDLNFNLEEWDIEPYHKQSILYTFNHVYRMVGDFETAKTDFDFVHIIDSFLGLGEMLGFTHEQIEQSYYQKNAINHTRQDNSY